MAIGLRLPNFLFTGHLGSVAPAIVSEAELFILPRLNIAQSVRNWVTSDAEVLIEQGVPAYSSDYVTLGNTAGFESPEVAGNGNFTYMMISTGNATTTSNMGLMGRWQSGDVSQDMLYHLGNTDIAVAVDGALRAQVPLPGLKTNFHVVAARYDGATAKVWASDGTMLNTASAAYVGGAAGAKKIRVGATAFPGTGTPSFRCAAALAWSDAITDQDVVDVANYLRSLMAISGVAVT